MGVSTDGIIGFGIPFGEGEEHDWPWRIEDEEEGAYYEVESWWQDIHGFKEKGVYESYDEYFKRRGVFRRNVPQPVVEVNFCSGDYPMYALCIPRTVIECSRGFPTDLTTPTDPLIKLDINPTDKELRLYYEFMEEYNIDIGDEKARWLLMSYWG